MLPVRTPSLRGPSYELLQNSADGERSVTQFDKEDAEELNFDAEDEPLTHDQMLPYESRNSGKSRSGRWRLAALGVLSSMLHLFKRSRNLKPLAKPATVASHSSTAWLDGLRGIACLMVVFYHSRVMFEPFKHPAHDESWLFTQLMWLSNLPLLNIWNNGRAMVAVFFVVSGFSISFSALGHARRRNLDKALKSIASSTFRRHLRLFLPPVITSFVNMLASYLGLYGGTGTIARHRQPPKFDSFSAQLGNWGSFVVHFTNPFQAVSPPEVHVQISPYEPNLWTIPTEFSGSIAVFATLFAVCQLRRIPRLLVFTGLTLHLFHSKSYNLLLFIGGALLAEVHYYGVDFRRKYIPEPHEQQSFLSILRKRKSTHLRQLGLNTFCIINFIMALYNIPTKSWMFRAFNALQLVFAIDNAACLQTIFTTRLARFLGKISFCLYLVHGGVLHTFGWRAWTLLQTWIGDETAMQHLSATTIAAVMSYALAIYIAHVLSWSVDDNSVAFVRWLWGSLGEAEEKSLPS